MSYHFYAMLSRMKNIYRWGLMRNTKQENLSEHSLEVAFIAHALAVVHNRRFGGNIDENKVAVAAMFHDTTEIITGDMPTPIKYYNPEICEVYKQIENVASNRLLNMLPKDLRGDFEEYYNCDPKITAFVKAADKLSALIKCTEELNMGNREFSAAKESTAQILKDLNMPEVNVFLEEFMESFSLSLDEQNNK